MGKGWWKGMVVFNPVRERCSSPLCAPLCVHGIGLRAEGAASLDNIKCPLLLPLLEMLHVQYKMCHRPQPL
jgi:hypothetical protein